jgi:hypothetical protein
MAFASGHEFVGEHDLPRILQVLASGEFVYDNRNVLPAGKNMTRQ